MCLAYQKKKNPKINYICFTKKNSAPAFLFTFFLMTVLFTRFIFFRYDYSSTFVLHCSPDGFVHLGRATDFVSCRCCSVAQFSGPNFGRWHFRGWCFNGIGCEWETWRCIKAEIPHDTIAEESKASDKRIRLPNILLFTIETDNFVLRKQRCKVVKYCFSMTALFKRATRL